MTDKSNIPGQEEDDFTIEPLLPGPEGREGMNDRSVAARGLSREEARRFALGMNTLFEDGGPPAGD